MESFFGKIFEWMGFSAGEALTPWLHVMGICAVALVVSIFAATYAGITSWYERRLAGRIQSRIGPNRNGPAGFFQWVMDAVKLIFKEGLIPADADSLLFRLAPYLVFIGFLLTFAVLPFGHGLIVADLNVGIFYLVAVTSLVVVGILMSGWASNSKWALFGGMRSAAQVISYEIPSGLALLVPILLAGTLSTQGLIEVQGGPADGAWYLVGGWPWNWTLFANPMAFCAFFVFMTAAFAEGNRAPFDLPEAESELVAGYFTEYSGIRFAIFFLTEWGNLYVMGALATILFLGGWQIPGFTSAEIADSYWLKAISVLIFVGKCIAITSIAIWVRWTLPRVRVDQMMAICWKYLVPIGLLLVLLTAASEWLLAGVPSALISASHLLFFVLLGLLPFALFIRQSLGHIRRVGDRVDLSNW